VHAQDELADAISTILQRAHNLGVTHGQAMVAQSAKESMVSVAQGFFQRAKDIVSGVIDRVQDVLADAVDRAKQAGVNIADALQEAMDTLLGNLPDTVGENEVHTEVESGIMDAFTSAGVQQVIWVTEPNACDLCKANESQGAIDRGDTFVSGDEQPPQHPHCRCSLQNA
jgi:hypothetical protein